MSVPNRLEGFRPGDLTFNVAFWYGHDEQHLQNNLGLHGRDDTSQKVRIRVRLLA